jgi:short-subunit dehydrogenase
MAYALVTGASAGLGLEFAKILAGKGYDLILASRDEVAMRKIAGELKAQHKISVEVFPVDLTRVGSAKELFSYCEGHGFTVEILVNNAGVGVHGAFLDHPLEDLTSMIHLNLITLTELAWLFGRVMKSLNSGYILNVASTAAFLPGPNMAGYYATKAFVLSLSEALSFEFRNHGINVTALCPGPTRTKFFDRAGMKVTGLKEFIFAEAEPCAARGIRGVLMGQEVVVDGWINRSLVFALRFLSRRLAVRVSSIALR